MLKTFLTISLLSIKLFSFEASQMLPGQFNDEEIESNYSQKEEKKKEVDPFLMFEEDQQAQSFPKGTSPFLRNPGKQEIVGDEDNPRGNSYFGEYRDTENYIEHKNDEIVKSYKYKSKDRINISLFYDSYDYSNGTSSFDRVYRDSNKIDVYGMAFFSYDQYLTRDRVSTLMGLGGGLGYNGGKGVFKDENLAFEASYDERAQMNLWTIPIDFRLSLDLTIFEALSLGLSAGPSVMFLWEHRSDKEEGEDKRDRRQFSPGYFASAQIKFNLGQMINGLGYKLLSKDRINRFFMNIEARYHNYQTFKSDNLVIDGLSGGVGFSYDFI